MLKLLSVFLFSLLGAELEAVTVDFKGDSTSTNGYYYWNDADNWQGGILPGTADAARFRYTDAENKAFLTGDVNISSLNMTAGVHAQIAGTGIITASSYMGFIGNTETNTWDVRDSVTIIIDNRIRFRAGTTEINLYDDASLNPNGISFDEVGSGFVFSLNGHAGFDYLTAPNAGSGTNIASGSRFELNDSSALLATSLTVQELRENWMEHGVAFYLNDAASIALQTDSGNATNIEACIAAGLLVINGSTNVTDGVDYVYDSATGILQAYPPYKVLFYSDTTHILTCDSPYHDIGDDLTSDKIVAAVDEAADGGADVFMLQPGLGWVPWWESQVLSLSNHLAWFRTTFRANANYIGFPKFVYEGQDFIQIAIDECRAKDVCPFISFRLNDTNNRGDGTFDPATARIDNTPQIYYDNTNFFLRPKHPGWPTKTEWNWDWTYEAARQYKLDQIEELCNLYDIDGFELDFMRGPYYFLPNSTTSSQRVEIITAFVGEVRQILDDSTPPGKKRWLGVRIPCFIDTHDHMGIDVEELAAAGVQMFELSTSYVFASETDSKQIKQLLPNSAVYYELTYTSYSSPGNVHTRRGTESQFYTIGRDVYREGLQGVTLFNFHYYRDHAARNDGPYSEPPFYIMEKLKDPEFLSSWQQQTYFKSVTAPDPWRDPDFLEIGTHLHPRVLEPGDTATFTFDVSRP